MSAAMRPLFDLFDGNGDGLLSSNEFSGFALVVLAIAAAHSVATCFVIRAQALLLLNVAERGGRVPEFRRPAVVAVVVTPERPRFHNRRAARRLVEF